MKTVVILSADSLGMAVAEMLNPMEMKLVGLGDLRAEAWNVFSDLEKGELKEEIEGMPVMPVDLAVGLQPDILVIATTDAERSHALEYMAIRAGFLNDIVFIRDIHEQFSAAASCAACAAVLTAWEWREMWRSWDVTGGIPPGSSMP